jgi:hypothetical protein
MRGHSETFSQLTNVDMKFGVLTAEDGQESLFPRARICHFRRKRIGICGAELFTSSSRNLMITNTV